MKKKVSHSKSSLEKCLSCGSSCCRYLTVKIKTPRSILDFDNLLWQIYHEGINIFKDDEGWYVLINNRCINLKSDGKCSIYEKRPITCREHSVDNCDADNAIRDLAQLFFSDAASLSTYCRKRFKSWDKRHNYNHI